MKKKPPLTYSPFDQEREKLHRNVLTSISHDLKTPLACIIGSLEIYERTKEKLSAEKKTILINTALQEAYRLDSFITNILDIAKFESNVTIIKKELCVMNLLMEDCLIMLGHRLQKCDITILPIPAVFTVITDSLLLMRAVCIILDNAAQYGVGQPIIRVEYERIGLYAVIRVDDNGPGIPPSQLEAIFSKYTRLNAQDHKNAGTGLGLPICREIMRLLGGEVTVKNNANGNGAQFTLTFLADE